LSNNRLTIIQQSSTIVQQSRIEISAVVYQSFNNL